jgi:hypothetical protein
LGVAVLKAFGVGAFEAGIFGFAATLPVAGFVGGVAAFARFGLEPAEFIGIQALLATPEGVEPALEFPFGNVVGGVVPMGEFAPLLPGRLGRAGDCRSELFG